MNKTFDIELKIGKHSQFTDYYAKNDVNDSIRFLNKFNVINVIVGANNSGKSRFIRNLMNIQELKGVSNTSEIFEKINMYNEKIDKFKHKVKVSVDTVKRLESSLGKNRLDLLMFNQNEEFSFAKIDVEKTIDSIIENITALNFTVKRMFVLFEYFEKHQNDRTRINNFINSIDIDGKSESNRHFFSKKKDLEIVEHIVSDIQKLVNTYRIFDGRRIYIPTLRTAHSLFQFEEEVVGSASKVSKRIRNDIYLDTLRKNYNNLNENVEIFTGLSLYNEIVNVRNSIKEERIKFHDFESFLSINFFEGKDVDIIAKFNIDNSNKGIEDDDLIQIHIGGKSRKLHNLGDGIQSLIILMYKIFLADVNSMIFIDEPELNLHPGYQRLFLEQITSNVDLTKKNLTYVIVTHSNHFLDLTLEKDNVSIYSFNSHQVDDKQKFIISNVNAGENQLLRSLGVNNSSVFLANCSIWVEGVSDRNFIKAFLIAYCKSQKLPEQREDIDFAFFEYAGSNLTHYNFRKGTNETKEVIDLITSYALNNKILLVSDLDDGRETNHTNIEEIAYNTDGFEYFTTRPYREIENLISNSIWSKVLLTFCNKKRILGKENEVQTIIEESLSNIKSDNYKTKYIGHFLKDLDISQLNKIYQIDKKNKNPGAFIRKAELSQLILQKVRDEEITWKDFSQNSTVVTLTEGIYNFILKSKG